ncbi:MAG: precorrin-2 C(20)-methyltransferase [Thermoleophilia bacterium]
MKSGTLFALGTGPGDPELVTVKAAKILGRVEAVAFPLDPGGRPGRAFRAATPYLRPDTIHIPLHMPMTANPTVLEEAWGEAVESMWAHACAGKDVAYLCLGDVLLYGSFGYLLERYPGNVEIVSGVISPVAAAASLGLPLAEGREPLTLVPDAGDTALLAAALELGGTVVIMKPSRLGEAGVHLLEDSGRLEKAWVAREVTLETESLTPARREELSRLPYFSLVVIPAVRAGGAVPDSSGVGRAAACEDTYLDLPKAKEEA